MQKKMSSRRRQQNLLFVLLMLHYCMLLSAVLCFSFQPLIITKKQVIVVGLPNTVHIHRHHERQRRRIRRTTSLLSISFSSSSSSSSASSSSSSSSSSPSLEYLEIVKSGIKEFGYDVNEWETCGHLLSKHTGLDILQSQDLLARAWNWKSWAVTTSKIARRYITPIQPNVKNLEKSLTWLQGPPLQLSTSQQLAIAIASDPVAYLIDPCTSYQQALQAAPVEYQQDESIFLALILEKPAALKNYYNCKDSGCNSECGNCWVSFQMSGEI